ncbi:hypothetical protein MJO28_001015 [Puccinia striiformis f. sp. tritici]|uniref:Uncharacterized protein n=1 Tax=Puccinia striiformis f. sp. tritici TaxID=168172 RepID=A0ACC0EZH3_9BASI|nr:hypothetical protein MJO28_001015 [Puccinia striiformis f. sp. tritici]KAI9599980.1 hypothetical protein KEM48_000094 [Puccinia striiformis f. sp. tritici PST-130]
MAYHRLLILLGVFAACDAMRDFHDPNSFRLGEKIITVRAPLPQSLASTSRTEPASKLATPLVESTPIRPPLQMDLVGDRRTQKESNIPDRELERLPIDTQPSCEGSLTLPKARNPGKKSVIVEDFLYSSYMESALKEGFRKRKKPDPSGSQAGQDHPSHLGSSKKMKSNQPSFAPGQLPIRIPRKHVHHLGEVPKEATTTLVNTASSSSPILKPPINQSHLQLKLGQKLPPKDKTKRIDPVQSDEQGASSLGKSVIARVSAGKDEVILAGKDGASSLDRSFNHGKRPLNDDELILKEVKRKKPNNLIVKEAKNMGSEDITSMRNSMHISRSSGKASVETQDKSTGPYPLSKYQPERHVSHPGVHLKKPVATVLARKNAAILARKDDACSSGRSLDHGKRPSNDGELIFKEVKRQKPIQLDKLSPQNNMQIPKEAKNVGSENIKAQSISMGNLLDINRSSGKACVETQDKSTDSNPSTSSKSERHVFHPEVVMEKSVATVSARNDCDVSARKDAAIFSRKDDAPASSRSSNNGKRPLDDDKLILKEVKKQKPIQLNSFSPQNNIQIPKEAKNMGSENIKAQSTSMRNLMDINRSSGKACVETQDKFADSHLSTSSKSERQVSHYKVINSMLVDSKQIKTGGKAVTRLEKNELTPTPNFSGSLLSSVTQRNQNNDFLKVKARSKMESMYFNRDSIVFKDPYDKVQIEVQKVLNVIKLGPTGSIHLTIETASQIFKEHHKAFSIKRPKDLLETGVWVRKGHFDRLPTIKFAEFVQCQSIWLRFWEKQTNFKFWEEIENSELLSRSVKDAFPLFLYYVQMIDIIINPLPQSSERIANLFRKATDSFIESGIFLSNQPGGLSGKLWLSVQYWIRNSGTENMKVMAFGGKETLFPNFKKFFNTVFRSSFPPLNTHLRGNIRFQMKRLYFNKHSLFPDHPNPIVQESLHKLIQKMGKGPEGLIEINPQDAEKWFVEIRKVFSIKNLDEPLETTSHGDRSNRSDKLQRESMVEFMKMKHLWPIFWERQTKIDFQQESKKRRPLSEVLKETLLIFMFYTKMIDMIIVLPSSHPEYNQKEISIRSRLAKKSFEESRKFVSTHDEAINMNLALYNILPGLLWKFLTYWIKEYGTEDQIKIAFGTKNEIDQNFKQFFNTVFRSSIKHFNNQLSIYEI